MNKCRLHKKDRMEAISDNNFQYDAVYISDLHLGNRFVDQDLLKQFLAGIKTQTRALYLVGDIFDAWRSCVPGDYLEMFSGFNEIIYIRGNHDGAFAEAQNPLPGAAVDSQKICWNGKNGVVTHAHLFDANFDKDSLWSRLADAAIYRFSRMIHCDLKANLGKIGENYSRKIEQSCAQIGQVFAVDFMIIGHTHYGGAKTLDGIKIFNLGSWLTVPYALFKAGDSYWFGVIEKGASFPAGQMFKPF